MGIEQYAPIYKEAAAQYDLDPDLLMAQGEYESGGDPNAVGEPTKYGRARGIPQLIPATAESLGVTDPTDPRESIFGQAKLMKENFDRYKTPEKALMAYHGGTDEKNWGPITQNYPKNVFKHYKMADNSTDEDLWNSIGSKEEHVSSHKVNAASSSDEDLWNSIGTTEKETPPATMIDKLNEKIETGLGNYQAQNRSKIEREVAGNKQGVRDVMASIQNLTGHPTLGGVLPTNEENLTARNAFNQQYGSDPVAGVGRFGGNIAAMTPLQLGAESALALGGNALTKIAPMTGPVMKFLGGGAETNAVRNAAGEVLENATLGNKAIRVASNATANAGRGVMAQSMLNAQSDEPIPNQLLAAAKFGATLGVGGSAVSAMYNKLTGANVPAPEFLKKIYEAAKSDGIALSEIPIRLAALGPNATLGDLGQNLRNLQGSAARIPGPGVNIITDTLNARGASQTDRLKNLALTGLEVDPKTTYLTTKDNLSTQQQKVASPIYKEAYAANQDIMSPEIKLILETPAGQAAMKKAVTTIRNKRELVGVSNPDLVEQAAMTGNESTGFGISSGLKLTTLDKVKQELWDLGEAAKGKRGEPTTESNAIHELRTALTDELDKADTTVIRDKAGNIKKAGKYSEARAAFADPAQAKEALDAGYEFMKNGAESNTAVLSKLSEAQKPYYRDGVAEWVKDTLHNAPDGADAVKRIFGSPAKREAIKSVFPNEKAFNKFEEEVNKESIFAATHHENLKNSLTTPRQRSDENLAAKPTKLGSAVMSVRNMAPSPVSAAAAYATGSHWPMTADVIGKLGSAAYNKITAPIPMSPQVSRELAETMVKPFESTSLGRLTPAALEQARTNRLLWYMKHLGVPHAVAGRNALLTPSPE